MNYSLLETFRHCSRSIHDKLDAIGISDKAKNKTLTSSDFQDWLHSSKITYNYLQLEYKGLKQDRYLEYNNLIDKVVLALGMNDSKTISIPQQKLISYNGQLNDDLKSLSIAYVFLGSTLGNAMIFRSFENFVEEPHQAFRSIMQEANKLWPGLKNKLSDIKTTKIDDGAYVRHLFNNIYSLSLAV